LVIHISQLFSRKLDRENSLCGIRRDEGQKSAQVRGHRQQEPGESEELRHAELLFQVLDTPFKSMLYPEQQSKGNQEDAVSGTVFAHGRSGDCAIFEWNSA
jgi:hypothetical protein